MINTIKALKDILIFLNTGLSEKAH